MKCYTIQYGNEYVANVPRVIRSSHWYGNEIQTVDCDDEAKHYKTKKIADTWLGRTIYIQESALFQYKEELKNTTHSYSISRVRSLISKQNKLVSWLKNAKVVELDIETPNFNTKNTIRWSRWRNDNRQSNMSLSMQSHGRYECKACGIILKNIPYYELTAGNPTKICIPCLHLRIESIKSAYEGMDEGIRETITNEILLGSL